jgi:hypothetical protein
MYRTIKNIKLSIIFTFVFFSGINELICNEYSYINSFSNASSCSEFIKFDLVNPAIISKTDSLEINFGFSPNRYLMSELNPIAAESIIPINKQLKIHTDLSGVFNDLYSNFNFGISSSYNLNRVFCLGIGMKYSSINIKDNGNYSKYDILIGSLIDLSSNFRIGVSANFANNYDSSNIEFKQISISSGFYNIENFNFDIGFNIEINNYTSFIIGTKYNISENIALRFAYKTKPNTIEAGIKIKLLKYLDLFYLLDRNSNLGYSNSLVIGVIL